MNEYLNIQSSFFDKNTHYLYLFILLLVFVINFISINKYKNRYLFVSICVLWFFAITRDFVGVDYQNYYELFNTATLFGYDIQYSNIEPGFYYINAILNIICSYEYFGFIFFHFIILFFLYISISYFDKRISYEFAILAYTALLYFVSFDLLRICVATSIAGFAFRYILQKEYLKYFIIIILLFNIHMSSIVMILPAIALIGYKRYPKIIITIFLLILLSLDSIISLSLHFISIERYSSYLDTQLGVGLGMNLLFTFIPLFYWLYLGRKYIEDKDFWNACFVFTLFVLLIDFGAYRIEILGRLRFYAVVPFMFYLPYLLKSIKRKSKPLYVINSMAVFIYILIKYYLLLPQLYWSDGLMPYKSFLF